MPERHSGLHLAAVLEYSKSEMATALSNNVVMRYASYVYRFVNTRLLPMELRRLGVQSLPALPMGLRADVLSGIDAVKKDIETRRHPKQSPERFHTWIDRHVDDLVRPKPSGAGNDWNAFDFLEDDIPRCLSYMVHINRLLEADGQRLSARCACGRAGRPATSAWTLRRWPRSSWGTPTRYRASGLT